MTSFVWLAIAALLGLMMPVIQFLNLNTNLYYTDITLHGAAMAFPMAFQMMVGVSLHRTGGCLGKRADGLFSILFYIFMNVGALLLTIAVLGGFSVTYTVMFPLPIVGVQTGQWSMNMLILGFTGIAMVLISMIFFYPIQVLRMIFFTERHEELVLSHRELTDPGMVGMIISVLILLVMGLPLMIVATPLLLALHGIVPMAMVSWAADPVLFQFAFYIFAHNLMEAMAIMVISAVYAILPLCLADGSRQLYSNKLANLALFILLVTSVTSFFHHFYTSYPALPSALLYHGNVMSYATGIGAGLTIFTILATIWKHGLKANPGIIMILGGFVLYIFDGVIAIVASNVALNFKIHGTVWVGGHAMAVLLAMTMMWMGIFYYHFPVITGRKVDYAKGYQCAKYYFIGGVGIFYSFMVGGAMGMPRRIANWEGNYNYVGASILLFGVILTFSFFLYFRSLFTSNELPVVVPQEAVV
jgi:cytochrome c oxidase subunit 1